MKFTTLLLGLLWFYDTLLAQENDTLKSYTTKRVEGEPPHIDGYLNDPAWQQVPWGGADFKQRFPDNGAPASVQTKFKILYDDKNLYVAFRNLDPEPGTIARRMSRRDGFEGDWVEINIDSYFDKRSAFSFTSSVSGVKGDEYISNNGDNWDPSWDPIWYLKTSIDAEGWIAELRIPLSQLRFADKPELTFGFQIQRLYFKNQEISNWIYIPQGAAGWVHHFGELRGITGVKPQKQLEVQPYVVTKAERFQKEEGNPFATGRSSAVDYGLDAKIGVTSDITLDLTVNPDFGQVEADPSQVNLSAFELFFQERRPFFIEGNNTLNFPITEFNNNNLFYSRRIGRRPQGAVVTDRNADDGVNEYSKVKNRTTILGAAKLTGKNKKGFSWGILESVTNPEKARIDSLGFIRTQPVEPLTNYFVSRAQQDINKGNTIVGGMFTATNRNLKASNLNWLHRDAYTGGLDFVHNWKDRKYYVSAKTLMSRVNGSKEALLNTQLSSERYFQRPDNNHAHVDSARQSLSGTGGTIMFGKKSGNLVFDVGYSWLSPGLELNDVGYLSQTDIMTQWVYVQYRVLNPVGITRAQRYNFTQTQEWDFDWKNITRSYNNVNIVEFKNFWVGAVGLTYNTHSISNADLRGGPAIRYPGNINYWLYAATDRRKKFQVSINPEWERGFNNFSRSSNLYMQFTYRPVNAFNISVEPIFSHNYKELQYVTTAPTSGEDRYVMGRIEQTTARISLRMTYMVTPNLSVQYYGQPFGTSGKYTNFKYISNGNAPGYFDRFVSLPNEWLTYSDQQYTVDENNGGLMRYSFQNPDFNFGQFRSNMVIRWEYIPGSTLFLVWTREKNGAFYDQQGSLLEKYKFDFTQKGHNIYLLKFTYRFRR